MQAGRTIAVASGLFVLSIPPRFLRSTTKAIMNIRFHPHPLLIGILVSISLLCSPAAAETEVDAALDNAIAGAHRSQKSKARDIYRHPKETLQFFGLKPDMTVVEIWPGGGWYTEILAPLLRESGKYYATSFATRAKGIPDYRKEIDADYRAMLKQGPQLYDKIIVTELEAPEFADIAPPESADLILTFRNVHNWVKEGNEQDVFKAFYDALKPGGVLGVVDHRAEPGTTLPDAIRSGYLTEGYVIQIIEGAGFKLLDTSEINANPKDTRDHPKGVWTLPPQLRLGDTDREKYLVIGESDRMTLKFTKPKRSARPARGNAASY